ncbi:hypothetical protein [Achromobacter sp. ESBL13]|uniref:hypothetical protein n=1 Tax=Achromobacter sp. ESBL13 TaxID=3077328 RepID=UPI003FA56653
MRATHVVVGGSPATMAGYGRLRGQRRARVGHWWRNRLGNFLSDRAARRPARPPVLAAAQLYALRFPSGGHCVIALPEGRYWLVAAQEGVVISQADRVFVSHDDALQAQARLQEQRPGLLAHDPESVWPSLISAVDPGARLAPLPSRWAGVPFALRLFLLCVAMSALAPPVWRSVVPYVLSNWVAVPAQDSAPPDPKTAYQTMLGGLTAHGPNDVARLLRSVGMLPVQVQGWALRRAQCDAGEGVWRCAAVYARAHRFATNQRLYARLPAGWQVSFKPLDEATLAWRVASEPVPLSALALPSGLHVDTKLVAALQRLQPAFASVSLASAVVLSLSNASVGGAQPSASQPQPVVRRRALRLQGPLRSIGLVPAALTPALGAARWSRLVVDVQAQAKPTLVASTLVAELQGELYEQD